MTQVCISRDKSSQISVLGDPGDCEGVGSEDCTSSCSRSVVQGFVGPSAGLGQTGGVQGPEAEGDRAV